MSTFAPDLRKSLPARDEQLNRKHRTEGLGKAPKNSFYEKTNEATMSELVNSILDAPQRRGGQQQRRELGTV